jgi:hypothetical protein
MPRGQIHTSPRNEQDLDKEKGWDEEGTSTEVLPDLLSAFYGRLSDRAHRRGPLMATMSNPRLPPEILDYIVDLLHNEPWWLQRCCLVAKSWVPRTRKYLFNKIYIASLDDLEAWWKVFPDPNSSPGHYTRTLFFFSVRSIFSGVAGGRSLVRPFSNVMRLVISSGKDISNVRFLP